MWVKCKDWIDNVARFQCEFESWVVMETKPLTKPMYSNFLIDGLFFGPHVRLGGNITFNLLKVSDEEVLEFFYKKISVGFNHGFGL